jgi:transcriptional regulator with XRE-family HTH domain
MTTLPTTSDSRPSSLQRISKGDMAYACVRFQHQVHNLLVKAIKESALSQKELARLTGIDEATISRLLSRPRNMEINTLSKLIYGANGATLTAAFAYPETGQPVILARSANVAVEEKKTDARRFVLDNLHHLTPVGSLSASTDKELFNVVTAASSGSRIREIVTNARS